MNALVKKKLKKSTIAYLLLGATGSLASQTAWIDVHVMLLFHNHPRMSGLGAFVVFLLTMLHTPQAIELLEAVQSEGADSDIPVPPNP